MQASSQGVLSLPHIYHVAEHTGLSLSAATLLLEAAQGDPHVAVSLMPSSSSTTNSEHVAEVVGTVHELPHFLLCRPRRLHSTCRPMRDLEGVWVLDRRAPNSFGRPVYRRSYSRLCLYFAEDSGTSERVAWVIGGRPGDVATTVAMCESNATCPEDIAPDSAWLVRHGCHWEEGCLAFRGAPPATTECVVCLDAATAAVLWPCGHPCMCAACAATLSTQKPAFKCPLCREPVQSSHLIHLEMPHVMPIGRRGTRSGSIICEANTRVQAVHLGSVIVRVAPSPPPPPLRFADMSVDDDLQGRDTSSVSSPISPQATSAAPAIVETPPLPPPPLRPAAVTTDSEDDHLWRSRSWDNLNSPVTPQIATESSARRRTRIWGPGRQHAGGRPTRRSLIRRLLGRALVSGTSD